MSKQGINKYERPFCKGYPQHVKRSAYPREQHRSTKATSYAFKTHTSLQMTPRPPKLPTIVFASAATVGALTQNNKARGQATNRPHKTFYIVIWGSQTIRTVQRIVAGAAAAAAPMPSPPRLHQHTENTHQSIYCSRWLS